MVSKYGIVEVEQQGDLFLVKNLVEKPEKEKVNPGYNGEIQLTDALKLLLDKQKIYAKKIEGKRYDIGDKLSYVKAIIDFSLGRENLKNDIGRYLKRKYV